MDTVIAGWYSYATKKVYMIQFSLTSFDIYVGRWGGGGGPGKAGPLYKNPEKKKND